MHNHAKCGPASIMAPVSEFAVALSAPQAQKLLQHGKTPAALTQRNIERNLRHKKSLTPKCMTLIILLNNEIVSD